MSETPNQSALLAAVLRVVRPDTKWFIHRDAVFSSGEKVEGYLAADKNDLARVVAMLTPEQTREFDAAWGRSIGWSRASAVLPSEALKATTTQSLAALVAATGAQVNQQ